MTRPTPENSTVVALGVAHRKSVSIAKAEIVADVRLGVVPPDVRDFSHLHDFVDANTYGLLTDGLGLDAETLRTFSNGVQNEVDAWIKADGIKEVLSGEEYIALVKRHAPVEDRQSLVFAIDVTGLSVEQRNAVEAAVSAQLDDGTEDYPAVTYESAVLDHDTERDIIGAVLVGLGL